MPVAKSQEADDLRRNSQKYDDLMKKKRDELKRKRGALELNSDLDNVEANDMQDRRADLP